MTQTLPFLPLPKGIGWRALALTGWLSLAAHGAVLAALVPPAASIEMAGGGASAPAALGGAFEDFTQGALPSAPVAAASARPDPAPAPAAPAAAPRSPATASTAAPPSGLVAAGAAPDGFLATLQAPALLPRAPAATPPTLAPAPEVAVRQADAGTPRPPQRPDFAARDRARDPAERARQAAAAQAAGDSASDTRRGSAEGTTGPAAQTAPQPAAQAGAPGNAALTNYPGAVMRRIQRVRQQRVTGHGTAVVAFTISPDGGLASAALARSSGSVELDRAALDHIRRAAPFPAPPPGVPRQFSFEFVGR